MSDPFTPGLLSRLTKMPRKVVLLRASRIGDFLCSTPAFRALRMALPGAEISMITLPLLQDLVTRSPHLDRFIAFPGFPQARRIQNPGPAPCRRGGERPSAVVWRAQKESGIVP